MKDRIEGLLEKYKEKRSFYRGIEDGKRASVYGWVIEDLEELIKEESVRHERGN